MKTSKPRSRVSQSHSNAKTVPAESPAPVVYQLHIRKDALKFSAAHMTVFSAKSKEGLHGHNYQVTLNITCEKTPGEALVSFAEFKSPLKELCADWDEKVLLPGNSPYFEVLRRTKSELDFRLCKKRYVLPQDEIEVLPVENVTSEALAELMALRLIERIPQALLAGPVQALQVRIEESPGQGASFVLQRQ